jgi:hypothetical protein
MHGFTHPLSPIRLEGIRAQDTLYHYQFTGIFRGLGLCMGDICLLDLQCLAVCVHLYSRDM